MIRKGIAVVSIAMAMAWENMVGDRWVLSGKEVPGFNTGTAFWLHV